MAASEFGKFYAQQAGTLKDFGESVVRGIDVGSQLAQRQIELDSKRQELEQKKLDAQYNKIKYFFDKVADGDKIKDSRFKNQYFKSLYENSAKFGINLSDDWKAFFQSNDPMAVESKQAFIERLNSPMALTPGGKFQLSEEWGKLTGKSTTDALPDIQKLLDFREKIANTEVLTGQSKEKAGQRALIDETKGLLQHPGMSLLGDQSGFVSVTLNDPSKIGTPEYTQALTLAQRAKSQYEKLSAEEKSKIEKEKLGLIRERTKAAKQAQGVRQGIAQARLYTSAVQQVQNGPTVRKYKDVLSQASADLAILESKQTPTAFEGKEVVTNLSRLFAGGVGVVPESRRKEFQKFFGTYQQEIETTLFSKIVGDPTKIKMTPKQVQLLKTVTKKYINRYEQLLDGEVKAQVDARVRSGAIPSSDRDIVINDISGGRYLRRQSALKTLKSSKDDAIKHLMSKGYTKEQAEKKYQQKLKELGG